MHFYRTQDDSVHWSDLPKFIREYLRSKVTSYDDLDVFSSDVRTSNFLVRDESGRYSFVHKSFMEYFVAEHFLESIRGGTRNGLDDLKAPTRYPVIWEFLLELLRADDVDALRKDAFTVDKASVSELASNRQSDSRKQYTSPTSMGNMSLLLLLKGRDLRGADLEGARFDNMVISNASFDGCFMSSASFKGTTLTDVSFKDAVLAHASFDTAHLQGVDFTLANLNRVDLRTASLDKATLDTIPFSKHWGSLQIKPAHRTRLERVYQQPKTISVSDLPDDSTE